MDHKKPSSFRKYFGFNRFSEVVHKNSLIRHSFKPQFCQSKSIIHSSTPDPSLTIKVMKIHNRDDFYHQNYYKNDGISYENDTLDSFIQNNAVTFISPHELINQIHIESNQSPKETQPIPSILSTISTNKITNFPEYSLFEYIPSECIRDKFSRKTLLYKKSKSNKSKIEITGNKILRQIKPKAKISKSEEFRKNLGIGNNFNFSKDFDMRKSPKPVIIFNKKSGYFKSLNKETSSTMKSSQIFYVPTTNFK